jgi:hypothetical protein
LDKYIGGYRQSLAGSSFSFLEGGGKPDGGETDVFPKDRLHPITHLHMDDVPGQVILFLFFPPKRIASAKL